MTAVLYHFYWNHYDQCIKDLKEKRRLLIKIVDEVKINNYIDNKTLKDYVFKYCENEKTDFIRDQDSDILLATDRKIIRLRYEKKIAEQQDKRNKAIEHKEYVKKKLVKKSIHPLRKNIVWKILIAISNLVILILGQYMIGEISIPKIQDRTRGYLIAQVVVCLLPIADHI